MSRGFERKRHLRKKTNKLLALIMGMILVLTTTLTCPKIVKAAPTANISISSASATVGENVTISLTLSSSVDIYASQIYLSYDSSILEYQSGSADTAGGGTIGLVNTETFKSKSFNFTFKVIAVGSSSISVVGNTRIIDGDEEDMKISSTKGSVTGKAPISYSSDNSLASLKISPGVLSPGFSPSVTYYTTSVDADVENLIVDAVANDANAKVSVLYANLDPGANTTYVVVTAQNGASKTYTIATTRGDAIAEDESETSTEAVSLETTELELMVDDAKFKIVDNLEEHPFPEGYASFVYENFRGANVRAAKSEKTDLVLFYLENIDGTKSSGFYIYDKDTDKFYPYNKVSQPIEDYVILPLELAGANIAGLDRTTANIAGQEVDCYTDANRSYFVFYGVNSEGHRGFYKYLISDQTIQEFDENAVVAGDTDIVAYSGLNDRVSRVYKWYFYLAAMCALVILLAAVAIIVTQSVKINKLYECIDSLPEDVHDLADSKDLLNDSSDLNDYIDKFDENLNLESEELELKDIKEDDK